MDDIGIAEWTQAHSLSCHDVAISIERMARLKGDVQLCGEEPLHSPRLKLGHIDSVAPDYAIHVFHEGWLPS